MRELFSPEEMEDRLRLTQFLSNNFIFHKKVTTHFRYPFDIDLMYKIYKRNFPDTVLSEADIELYFVMLGAINETGHIFTNLRAQHKNHINDVLWD